MNQKHEKNQSGEIVVNNRFVKWLDNFWYHNKWKVIIISFFLVVGLICFTQCMTKEEADLRVTYAGDISISAEQQAQFTQLLSTLISAQKEEPKTVQLSSFYIADLEQLRAEYLQAGYSEYDLTLISNTVIENRKSFDTHIMTGDCAVYFVSAYTYNSMSNIRQLMRPLDSMYPNGRPATAYDEYAIRLGDTEFYQYYELVQSIFPPDTLILMPAQIQMGASADDSTYAEYENLYRTIVDFKAS